MADALHYANPPRRSARRGGIRSVAEFRNGGNRLALGGSVQFTSPGCGVAVGEVALCYPSPATTQAPKARSGVSTLDSIGPIFGAYAGVECFLDGLDYEANARELLANGEDRVIEEGLNDWLATATSDGTLATITAAVAAADNLADKEYPGLPVLVMNRGDAAQAFADGVLDADAEGNLWTGNGTPVLSSSSITAGKVYATGSITVLETVVGTFRTQILAENREFAIAEKVFAILVDCEYAASYTVDATP